MVTKFKIISFLAVLVLVGFIKTTGAEASDGQIVYHGSRTDPLVALTFDADMTPGMIKRLQKGLVKSWYNSEIKQTLDQNQVRATIFLTGLWAETYPEEAKDLANDPLIEIGNHSYSHSGFTNNCFKLKPTDNKNDQEEIKKAQEVIKKATGVTPKYFRFPGGCFDNIDLQVVNDLGLTVIQWDVVSGDAFNNSVSSIVKRVESKVKNGSVIVFHLNGGPNAPKTNEALHKIIPDLKKRGFQFVTISELQNLR